MDSRQPAEDACAWPKISGFAPAARLQAFFAAHFAKTTMTTQTFDNVSVSTQANVYFDGKCVSHGITLADGTKKSVGVVLPATLTFNTGAPEIMECVAGSCEYKLAGSDSWVTSSAGEKFSVPGNSKFEIRVADAYHYICHFG
jgi:uncharacterized protein YaiE (UPF0345 family)